MKKMNLESLPKHKKGKNKGKINWNETIGLKVPFIYDDIEGEIEIIDYNKDIEKLFVAYKDKTFYIDKDNIRKCRIGKIVGRRTGEFKKEIGEIIKDKRRDLIITDRERRRIYKEKKEKYENEKWYKYKCNKCSNEDWIIESNLITGEGGCNVCNASTPKIKLGINTIWDTDRWMVDLGVSEEDAKIHGKGSHDKIEVVCPDCGRNKEVLIYNIYQYKSIGCTCGDRFSYPEKFVTRLLSQTNIQFEVEFNKKWSIGKRYDFYLPDYNMIIETHGIQHYEQTRRKGAKTLVEEQENDRIKKELALSNGIKHYIELDCRHSELEYIKNSILNSKMAELFDLSNINWSKCEEFALSNLTKDICDCWNNKEEWETANTIAKNNKWGIKDGTTIRNYLKKGSKLGWCDYNSKEEVRKNAINCNKLKAKEVEVFKNGKSLGVFESATELARQSERLFGIKLDNRNISMVCRGKRKHHKGFTFKYVEKDEIYNNEDYPYAI